MPVVQLHTPNRNLSSWIAGFLEYTDGIQSPEIFRRWVAILAIAGALEQKVWIRSQGAKLYANLYAFLVGPPGVGKSNALHEVEELWREIEGPIMAPTSLTKPALMDAVFNAQRFLKEQHLDDQSFNSLMIAVGELGALIPGYDSDFLNALTYLYDCKSYSEKRRSTQNELRIDRPQVNLLACCTPSFLVSLMPMAAWEQGFLSRVIIVYSDVAELKPLNLLDTETRRDANLRRALVADLQTIANQYRNLTFSKEANDILEQFHLSRHEHEPTHPRLQHYNSRRTTHLLKLCMIASMDHSDTPIIDLSAARTARNWLEEAESQMEDVFRSMGSGGDAQTIKELFHYMLRFATRNNGVVPSHAVYSWLLTRAPANSHQNIVSLLQRSGNLKVELQGTMQVYRPIGELPAMTGR